MRITQAWLLALAMFSLAAPPALARAADVAFFPLETSNLVPGDAIAVGELLAQSYASVSRQAVLSPTRSQHAVAQAASYEAAAASLGVAEYVRTSALSVGRLVVITATRYAANGTPIYQSKLTANSLEDVPAVTDRMAKALYYRVDHEEMRTRHNVVLDEARVKPRRATEKVFGPKTGIYVPFAKGAEYDPHLGLQFNMRLEMERFFLEFGAGFILPTRDREFCHEWSEQDDCSRRNDGNLSAFTTEIGASYFLSSGNIAPYVGVGLLPRIWIEQEDDLASVSGYAQVGLMLPRDTSTRFYADARVAQAMIKSHLYNGEGVFPTELTFHLGVGF